MMNRILHLHSSNPIFILHQNIKFQRHLRYFVVLFRRPFVLYNSLTHSRTCVVRVHTSSAHVVIQDGEGKIVPTQVDPFWVTATTYSETVFKVRGHSSSNQF